MEPAKDVEMSTDLVPWDVEAPPGCPAGAQAAVSLTEAALTSQQERQVLPT